MYHKQCIELMTFASDCREMDGLADMRDKLAAFIMKVKADGPSGPQAIQYVLLQSEINMMFSSEL